MQWLKSDISGHSDCRRQGTDRLLVESIILHPVVFSDQLPVCTFQPIRLVRERGVTSYCLGQVTAPLHQATDPKTKTTTIASSTIVVQMPLYCATKPT